VPDSHISSARVRQAFSRSAASYDGHAVLQREVADRLLAHMEFTKLRPRTILDIGAGTGYFTNLLHKRFKRASVHAIDIAMPMLRIARQGIARRLPWRGKLLFAQADSLNLPYPDGCFDLVCSNLTMQWVSEPRLMLAEMRRVLAPGGLMIFSTFGRRTLAELRQSLASIDPHKAGLVLPFPDVTTLGNTLMELPVELPVTDSDLFTLTYPNAMCLLRELKGLGASAKAIAHRPGGLYGRALIRQLEPIYHGEHGMEDGRIPATFEALYGQAWHAEQPTKFERVIPISPEPV